MTTSTALSSLPAVSSAVTVVPQACGLPVCVTGVHPAAALFPLMHGSELELLVEDIVKNGLREPIVLYQGLILDGRNRLHACELAQVEPRFIGWDGEGSPLAFVLSRNLHRRHLDESQRAVIAARAKVMFKKEATDRDRANRLSSRAKSSANEPDDEQNSRVPANGANLHRWQRVNAKAGVVLNVSARLVATATRVLATGDDELITAVETGLVSVSDAAAILELPKDKQRQAVAAVHSGNARTLRQAVELSLTGGPAAGGEPSAPQVSLDAEPPKVSVRQLRRACQRFTAGHAKLCRDIDRAAQACGGANDHTRRAFEALSVALRAMQTCLQEFAPRVRPK